MDDWESVAPSVVFNARVGSILFGTNDRESDVDTRGVYVGLPVELRPKVIQAPDGSDGQLIELRTFAERLMAGDNNTLEVLFGQRTLLDPRFHPIWDIRHHFVSAEWIKMTRRMFDDRAKTVKVRKPDNYQSYLAHAWRVFLAANLACETGAFNPRLATTHPEQVAPYRLLKRGLAGPELILEVETIVQTLGDVLDVRIADGVLSPVDRGLVQRRVAEVMFNTWEKV